MSEQMGVAKPDRAFFARALELMGSPAPSDVAYVGDRVDNDVFPVGRRRYAVRLDSSRAVGL